MKPVDFRRHPQMGLWLGDRELVVDNFAGGGGASTGIEMALGRPVDIAINHDAVALSVHTLNHPHTRHYCESVWDINPREVTNGLPVGLAWFSPDCTHFSKAKGGQPVKKEIRGLAWVALRWAATVRPRVIMLENVEEFVTWGPIQEGQPISHLAGITFRAFLKALQHQGYQVEYKVLRACDYGAPTIRKRLFLIARCDGQPICWPEPTHGTGKALMPYRTAGECIDWTIPCPSIFGRDKPLAEKTLQRIARGIQKFVVDDPNPYVVDIGGQPAIPMIARQFGAGVCHPVTEPMRSVMAGGGGGKNQLVMAFLAKHYSKSTGCTLQAPIHTITHCNHHSLVTAFLVKYYGCGTGHCLNEPLHTITSKDRLGLVTVRREQYQIVDIGMRMLAPKELYAGQGFPADYQYQCGSNGQAIPKTKQVALCGNSVSPPIAAALVRANIVGMKHVKRQGRVSHG